MFDSAFDNTVSSTQTMVGVFPVGSHKQSRENLVAGEAEIHIIPRVGVASSASMGQHREAEKFS